MTNAFLNLPKNSQAALIKSAENSLGLVDAVLEKDLWVCKLLEVIFSMPYNMAFKGGTSLSKGYGLINRFSEDVDITIDYRHFRDPIDLDAVSRSQLKKISNELKSTLNNFVNTYILSYLNEQLQSALPNTKCEITINENGEQLRVYYPTVLNRNTGYIKDHVLLEFGIRNEIEPQEQRIIKPYIMDALDDNIILPMPNIDTLSPVRTFWEKSTLIHVECHRDKLQISPNRSSRHWYDIFILNQSWVGKKALQSTEVLENVIKHKKAFFNASYANYDDCLQGKFRIIPDTISLASLENDYKQMCDSGMFSDSTPNFSEIITSLRGYENQLNERLSG